MIGEDRCRNSCEEEHEEKSLQCQQVYLQAEVSQEPAKEIRFKDCYFLQLFCVEKAEEYDEQNCHNKKGQADPAQDLDVVEFIVEEDGGHNKAEHSQKVKDAVGTYGGDAFGQFHLLVIAKIDTSHYFTQSSWS